MKRIVDWLKYHKRYCYSAHDCCLCGQHIKLGEFYYDGGYGRRAHEKCVATAINKGAGENIAQQAAATPLKTCDCKPCDGNCF